jgi:hypothetical protein
MRIDLKNCTFKLIGGSSGEELEFKVGNGNLQYTCHHARTYELDRGRLDSVKDADEQPMDVSFDFIWDWVKSWTSAESPDEILANIGLTGGWSTTDDDDCAPASCDIEVTHTVICGTSTKTEVITFPKFRHESRAHDAKNSSIAVVGKCNTLEPTITHST